MPVFECGTVWSPLAEGPFFNGTLVPRIQLAILKTSKIMSWPRLARPRDLVGSLVWRGDDRATEIFFLFTLEQSCQADNNQKYNKSGTVEGVGFQILR